MPSKLKSRLADRHRKGTASAVPKGFGDSGVLTPEVIDSAARVTAGDLRTAPSLLIFAAVTVLFAAAGCGYHVAGRAAALPATWHTLAVPMFVNRTPTYRIEQPVTNAVIHEFLTRTKYRVVPRATGADAVLRGEITDIQAVPLLFDATSGHVNTMLVTVKLKVSLIDEQSNKIVYRDDNFVFRNEYQVSSDVHHFFQEEGPAMDRLSRDFASDLVSRVLEGF